MKRILFYTVFLLATFSVFACSIERNQRIKGSGKLETEQRSVGTFDEIDVSRGITVYLTQGPAQPIRIEADNNLLSHIKTEVRDNTLEIYFPNDVNVESDNKICVYVSTPHIKSLEATTAGAVLGENSIKTEKLELSVSTAGSIEIDVIAKEIDTEASTAGVIRLEGETDDFEASASTAGKIKAMDLTTQKADVEASTAGVVNITILGELKCQISTGAKLNYRGDVITRDCHASTGGSINKEN